jgi:hypothetical protein
VSTKLDEMWAALEAHKPKRGYAKAWRVMCKERTEASAWKAHDAAFEGSAAEAAEAAAWAAMAVWVASVAWADRYAQKAIDAIAKATEVKP